MHMDGSQKFNVLVSAFFSSTFNNNLTLHLLFSFTTSLTEISLHQLLIFLLQKIFKYGLQNVHYLVYEREFFYLNFLEILAIISEEKPGWLSFSYWLAFYRHRIVRLWPAYFYTLAGVIFLSSVHFHDFWPELDPVEQCSKYWWQNLLFISSLFGNKCMGWTW